MIVKMKAGRYKVPVVITAEKGRLYLQFPYNQYLLQEIKSMKNRRWHGFDDNNPRKVWSVQDCARNRFQISYLAGHNPYERYDKPLLDCMPNRDNLYSHQLSMFRHIATRIQCLVSGEMGVGKTLSAIEAMEYSRYTNFIWVGTGSSLAAVKLEFRKWKSELQPLFLTYHSFRNSVKNNDLFIPEGIIFDESQKLKSPTTQQSQAADTITEEMRQKFDDPFILCMSGAPAPNNPSDWWHQCEIVCPGFLREGDWYKFRDRLAVMNEQQSMSGQAYFKVVTWKDDEKKCEVCGKLKEAHDLLTEHDFKAAKNEIKYLYERMKGLNIVYFKKDCLDLPELQYKVIRLQRSELIKKAEQLIIKTVPRTVTALMKLRELSDGFQYKETETGETEQCPLCKGSGSTIEFYDPEYPDEYPSQEAMESGRCKERSCECTHCKGLKEIPKLNRTAKEIDCPKEALLKDLLEEHEEIGRFVVYAGFQASVDRCQRIALENKWDVIRADGRGWMYFGQAYSKEDMLEIFQDPKNYQQKIVFIGQAGAAGTGLTLTASQSIFFYSNSFNADDRIQAINRIHRIGMGDKAIIIDCVHLETDQYVLDNLEKKFDLLKLSMGQLREYSSNARERNYIDFS